MISLGVDNASKRSWLSRLKNHFRNYQQADLAIHAGQLVISDENSVSKTNLLEAVSLLSPGRGMRRAKGGILPILLTPMMDCCQIQITQMHMI